MADDRKKPKAPDTSEVAGVGAGIGDLVSPYIGELDLDPRRQGSAYRQALKDNSHVFRLYRNTMKDEQVYSTLNQRLDAAIAVGWEVEPGGTMRRDKVAAESLKEQLEQLDFDAVCKQMLHAVWYGYSVGEIMWMRDGARVVLEDIRVRAVDRFRWGEDQQLLLRTYQQPLGMPIPDRKFWLLRRAGESSDVPHGPGLAFWCYWPAWFRRNGNRFWAVAMEKFGMPTPKGKYPKGDNASKEALIEVLNQLAGGSGVALPEGQDIELLQSFRTMSGDFKAFPEYFDRMISKVILGQSSTTEQGPWRGTAEVQKDVRDEVIVSDCRLLNESFMQISRWITEWNHPGAEVPKVIRDASPPEDLDARAQREERISRMSGLRPTQKHVEETYGGEWEPKPMPASIDDPKDGEDNGDDDAGRMNMAGGDDPPLLKPSAALANAGGDDGDPVEAISGQLRGILGPIVDSWTDPIREALDNADSLGGVRDWIDERGMESIDPAPFVAALGEALVAAELAGRYDTLETNSTDLALASASQEHSRLTFKEQIEFFRGKVNRPTAAWTDLWQSQHDKAFVVAGARGDVLIDFRSAVTRAIENGTTLADFRRDFDSIVKSRGWDFKGDADWRARVIYGTNVRTSYQAGRYRQMKDMADRRPYWRYRHSHAVENPRKEHLSWDGLILHHSDPWWDTHYTPNGWGCQCYIESLSIRDMERLGLKPGKAPEIEMRTVTVGQRGPHPRVVDVPKGIDPGWAYAPGQSLMRTAMEKTIAQSPAVASQWARELVDRPRLLSGLHREFGVWLDGDAKALNELFVPGTIIPKVTDALTKEHGIDLRTVALSATRRRIDHGRRDKKQARGQALSREDLLRMPDVLASPKAVLLDIDGDVAHLTYAFSSMDGSGRMGKFVFQLNWKVKKSATNSYLSSGYVAAHNLREPRYTLLHGSLGEEEG